MAISQATQPGQSLYAIFRPVPEPAAGSAEGAAAAEADGAAAASGAAAAVFSSAAGLGASVLLQAVATNDSTAIPKSRTIGIMRDLSPGEPTKRGRVSRSKVSSSFPSRFSRTERG